MRQREIARYFPDSTAEHLLHADMPLAEVRVRANAPVQLIFCDGSDRFVGDPVDMALLREIAVSMMDYSYYAREGELSKGFFTMKNGCRVGVSGSFSETGENIYRLRTINSLCIRIAREVKGCAEGIVQEMIQSDGMVCSALILSMPGMGKTTILRDTARILSERGYRVGIVDERHEIAACCDGIPAVDLGPRSDVVDGCPKALAMEILIRSLSPQVIITDEIGNARDCNAIRETARMGVALAASAHAAKYEQFERGNMGILLKDGIFQKIILLGSPPGHIRQIYSCGGN